MLLYLHVLRNKFVSHHCSPKKSSQARRSTRHIHIFQIKGCLRLDDSCQKKKNNNRDIKIHTKKLQDSEQKNQFMNFNVLVLSMDNSSKELKPRRLRVLHACDRCRSKKKKCDGKHPCKLCEKTEQECTYIDKKRIFVNSEESKELAPLPPLGVAIRFLNKSWNATGILFRFYHQPSIVRILHSLYSPLNQLTQEQSKARALVYAILAVGALFSKDDWQTNDDSMRDFCNDEGERYFLAAKSMLDITNTADMFSLQTMCMLTLFLQSSAKLRSCYYFMGVTLRAALSEGLHRKESLTGNATHDECKKQLFWAIYKADIFMSCISGLPHSISQESVSQGFPTNFLDETINCEELTEQAREVLGDAKLNHEHTKLVLILLRIQKTLYPTFTWNETSCMRIMSLKNDLDAWLSRLPVELLHDYKIIRKAKHPNSLKPREPLYLDYLFTKLLLTTPFIHYIVLDALEAPYYSLQIALGWSCIEVAHEVIQLAPAMVERKMILSGHWFSMHTLFQSVKCLAFYQHLMDLFLADGNRMDVQEKCRLGLDILTCLKKKSKAGERKFTALNLLFENFIPKKTDLSLQLKNALPSNKSVVKEESELDWWIDKGNTDEIREWYIDP